MSNQPDKPSLPVTDRTPRPGDFPVGSPASRAAARALLRRKDDDDEVVFTVRAIFLGEDDTVVEQTSEIRASDYRASGLPLPR
jgi:hypothetical protein